MNSEVRSENRALVVMETIVIVVHVLAALGVTGLVLIQHGKGADMGASFGSGASQTIFGSVGSGNALTKSTSWLATIFFITSLVLALFAKQQAAQGLDNGFQIENADQFSTNVQQDADIPAAADPAASDLPVLPEAQVDNVPVDPQVEETAVESASDDGEATTQEAVEESAEDSQNATPN